MRKKYDGMTSIIELPLKTEKWQGDVINKKMDHAVQIYNDMLHYKLGQYKELTEREDWKENECKIIHFYDLTNPIETVTKKYDSFYNKKLDIILNQEHGEDFNQEEVEKQLLAEKEEVISKLLQERAAFEEEIISEIDQNKIERKARQNIKKSGVPITDDRMNTEIKKVLEEEKKKITEEKVRICKKEAFQKKNDMLKEARFTEFGFNGDVAKFSAHYTTTVSSNMACLTIAAPLWVAFSKFLFGNGKKVHYKKRGSINTIKTNGKSGIRLITENNRYYLILSNSPYKKEKNGEIYRFKARYSSSHPVKIEVLVGEKEYNKEMLQADISNICIKRVKIRDQYKYFVQFSVRRFPYKKKDENGNLIHPISDGTVGLCIWRNRLCAVSKDQVKTYDLSPGYSEYSDQLSEIGQKMDQLLRLNNPDNYNENGTVKSGIMVDGEKQRLIWVKSRQYKELSKKYREVSRKYVETRSIWQNKIVYNLLSMGNEFFIYDTSYLTKKVDLESKTKKEQQTKADRRRSIMQAAPSEFINKLNRKLQSDLLAPVNKVVIPEQLYWYNHAKGLCNKDDFGDDYMMLNMFESIPHTLYRAFMMLYYDSDRKEYRNIPEDEWNSFLERAKMENVVKTNKNKI